MKKHMLKAMLLLIWLLTSIRGNNPEIFSHAQNSALAVTFPVDGKMIFEHNDKKIRVFDTKTMEEKVSIDAIFRIENNTFFNDEGDRFNYSTSNIPSNIYNFNTNTSITLSPIQDHIPNLDEYFVNGQWLDNNRFLLEYYDIGSSPALSKVGVYNLDTQTYTLILPLSWGESITTLNQYIPSLSLPIGIINEYTLSGSFYFYPHPQLPQWLFTQIYANGPTTTDEEGYIYSDNIALLVLWNFQTGESMLLNSYLDFDYAFGTAWSSDGKRLFLRTRDDVNRIYQIETLYIGDLSIDSEIEHLYTTAIPKSHTILDSFGYSDLILTMDYIENSSERSIYITDVTQNQYHSQKFIQDIPALFSDFYLDASDTEKWHLSCLFDRTLPTQLVVGGVAKVAFREGTPAGWRAFPGITEDILAQVAEGTVFDIIREPECRDGSRWWQVRLSDGTEGFVAEASTDEYFIEPVVATPFTSLIESDSSTTVTESGITDTYTLALGTQPTADVVVSVTGTDQIMVSPVALTFTQQNWDVPQTVTVSAVDDSVDEGDHTAVITHSAVSADTGYNGLSVADVTVSITDDD